MDRSILTDEERKKLLKTVQFYKHLPLYAISLACIFGVVKSVLDNFPIIQNILSLIIILSMIFLLLNTAVLKRCPRCASWGTPASKGHCTKCGLSLDPTYKANQNN